MNVDSGAAAPVILDGLLSEEPEGLIDADLLAFLRETVREGGDTKRRE